MHAFLLTSTLILLIATILPLFRVYHWTVRAMDFPRVQLAVFAIILLILQLVFLDLGSKWYLLVITILCLARQLWWIIPYTPLGKAEVQNATEVDNNTLSIITCNVYQDNRNADALMGLVKQYKPDVLVTLETDSWWEEQLDTLGFTHSLKCPKDNYYGMHVYSHLALENTEISYLVERDVPSMHMDILLESGIKVRAHFLHPAPPSPTENEESKERDTELILAAKMVEQHEGPNIVTGDLNDVAWSYTTRLFRKISGLLDPRVGRGMFNTFHAKYAFFRWPLDHIFHTADFKLAALERLPTIGSDHFPLYVKLVYQASAKYQQEGLEVEEEDVEVAEEIIEENL